MSYQIKRLETQLRLTLFVRRNRSVALSIDGERIAKPIVRAFDLMEDALHRRESGTTLSITTTSSLASMWLIPRLGSFQERHPDIELNVSALNDIRDIEGGEYDLGIRLGRGDWTPLVSERLFDIRFTPMCSPAFLRTVEGVLSVADLPALPLIAQDDRRWNIWFADAGYPNLERVRGLRIVNQSEVIAAACVGQGFGLGIPFFAAPISRTARWSVRSVSSRPTAPPTGWSTSARGDPTGGSWRSGDGCSISSTRQQATDTTPVQPASRNSIVVGERRLYRSRFV